MSKAHIKEFESILNELYDFKGALKAPFLPCSYPKDGDLTNLYLKTGIIMIVKRMDSVLKILG